MKKVMNKEEEIVGRFLEKYRFENITHEPNGNISPDFSINDGIAIEVRKLNYNYIVDGKRVGYAEEDIPKVMLIRSILKKYDKKYFAESYWVDIEFKRPFADNYNNNKNLNCVLQEFINGSRVLPYVKQIEGLGFLRIYQRKTERREMFRIAITHDDGTAEIVHQIYTGNIEYCIKEKTIKIEKEYKKFNKWWLILVDNNVDNLENDEIEMIINDVTIEKYWERVIILDCNRNEILFEIDK
jgi:hypothetical protein